MVCPSPEMDCLQCREQSSQDCVPHVRAAKRDKQILGLVREIHGALISGMDEKPGILERVRTLEKWRTAMASLLAALALAIWARIYGWLGLGG